jgi:8-hydroxy-5-deazaflavin:NADPH oxidoreductase
MRIPAHPKEHLMAHLSILGTGNMGQAIAAVAAKGGHTVQLLGTDDIDSPVTGEIVVLAVPYPAIADVIAQRGESLAGKIVVDITNPLNFETFDALVVPADSSAAAQIAAALPQSRVLKAANTTFAATLAAGTVGPLTTTVLIAGDDADAKATLAGVFTSGGLEAIDAGSLKRARELEAVGFLQLTLAVNEKVSWTGGFGIAA